jgi:anti-sigma B factor antagonist
MWYGRKRGEGRSGGGLVTPAVHVDVRDATFIDSTGLGALVEGYRAAVAARAACFVVVNPSPRFRRVLTVTGLHELFGVDEDGDLRERTPDVAG